MSVVQIMIVLTAIVDEIIKEHGEVGNDKNHQDAMIIFMAITVFAFNKEKG